MLKGMCCHEQSLLKYCILATRLAMKLLSRCGEVLIHARAIVESVYKTTSIRLIFKDCLTFCMSCTANRHADNSSLGMEIVLRGTTRDLLDTSLAFAVLN